MKRVVVGMSGGVDSSVAALLLKQQGFEVIGLFMRNWNDAAVTLEDECPWIDDSRDAMMVAEQLGIPFQVIDLSEIYKEKIVDYMFAEYERGRTPNPDVLCNREIKFDVFLKEALKLGADFVATGHYVRKGETVDSSGEIVYQLLGGMDPNKDQSYFLCQLNQFQLSRALFPIGELQKAEVRKIAEENGLVTAAKKDSQGLCFIGKVSLPDFLQQKLAIKSGDIIEIDREGAASKHFKELLDSKSGFLDPTLWLSRFQRTDGKVIARHQGAHFYTRGQRRGLQIGGKPLPLFVLDIDTENNLVYVGQGEDHVGLYAAGLFIHEDEAHWVRLDLKEAVLSGDLLLKARIRYRQALFEVKLSFDSELKGYQVLFEFPQKAVTPGQFAAVYFADEIIFSGVISD